MFDSNWQITSVVEASEFTWSNYSSSGGTSFGFLRLGLVFGLEERTGLASNTIASLQDLSSFSSNALLLDGDRGTCFNGISSLWHVVLREVTKSGVLRFREQLVL